MFLDIVHEHEKVYFIDIIVHNILNFGLTMFAYYHIGNDFLQRMTC